MFKFVFLALALTGCTYSLTMADADGRASDVVDQTVSPQNSFSPEVSIPLKG